MNNQAYQIKEEIYGYGNTKAQNQQYADFCFNNRDALADCNQCSKFDIDMHKVCDVADRLLVEEMNVQEARDVFYANNGSFNYCD